MVSVPSGEWTDRETDQRPGTALHSGDLARHRAAPGRHRPPQRRRWLWTSGLVSAVIGASLVTPWPSVTSAAPVQPAAQQVSSTTAAARTTAPAPTTSTRRTTTAPRPTTTTSAPRASTPARSTTSVPAPTASTPAPTPTPGPTGTAATGNPLAGDTFYAPNTGAAAAATQPARTAEEAALLAEMARVPTALWLGAWSGDVTATVRREVAAARAAGAVPVFVTYNVPGRDCGGDSPRGGDSPPAHLSWGPGGAGG